MKRYPWVIGATAAGMAGILTFHSHATHSLANSVAVTPQKSSTTTSTSPPTTTPSTGSSASPSTTTTTAPNANASNGTATGKMEQYGYGELSVQVTVSGSKITDAKVVGLQTADSYSQQIAQQVIPYLHRQVLATQNARINGISGATYTSEAYAMSLQSALDKLHFH